MVKLYKVALPFVAQIVQVALQGTSTMYIVATFQTCTRAMYIVHVRCTITKVHDVDYMYIVHRTLYLVHSTRSLHGCTYLYVLVSTMYIVQGTRYIVALLCTMYVYIVQ